MAAGAVSVKGYRELLRAFKEIDKDLAKEIRSTLKEKAEPVRQEAERLFRPFDERSAAGYRVAVRARGVAVTQRIRRTTGAHPEFGAQQMRTALVPALGRKQEELLDGLEEMLDDLGRRNGF